MNPDFDPESPRSDRLPQAYYHAECETVSRLPTRTWRSLLDNPHYRDEYIGRDTIYCEGCQESIDQNEAVWAGENDLRGGETVRETLDQLQASLSFRDRILNWFVTPGGCTFLGALAVGFYTRTYSGAILGAALGGFVGLLFGESLRKIWTTHRTQEF